MISRYSAHGLTWIDLESPTKDELDLIGEEFAIPGFVRQEMVESTLRSKVDLYPQFLYLVLHFPVISPGAPKNSDQEVDFIIGKDFLITTRYELVEPVQEFSKIFERQTMHTDRLPDAHGGIIFMQMIKSFYKKSLRELEDMTTVLREIEDRIFTDQHTSIVRDISRISRKLLDFKQAIRFHGEVLSSYESASRRLFGDEYMYYAEVITSEFKKVNSLLEAHRDIVDELQRTNEALLSSKSNEIMKNFTIMTFVMLPLGLITGIFGMNTSDDLIFIKGMSEFLFVIGAMVLTGAVLFIFFKFKRWI